MKSKTASPQSGPQTGQPSPATLETPLCGLPAEFYCATDYDAGQSTGALMRQILNSVSQQVTRELEPQGLTNAQWVPMLKIYLGKASTVAELARVCQLDAGSMTRLLDRLEAKGFCRRIRSSEDRRVVNIELTPEGREAAKEIPVVLSRVQNAHLAGFTMDEWQSLKGYLRRILETAHTLQAANEKDDK